MNLACKFPSVAKLLIFNKGYTWNWGFLAQLSINVHEWKDNGSGIYDSKDTSAWIQVTLVTKFEI